MARNNNSKPGINTDLPALDTPFDASNYGGMRKNPEDVFGFQPDRIKREVSYINESNYDLSVIDGMGLTFDLPAANTFENRFVIKVSYTWGNLVNLNLAATLRHCPNVSKEFITDLNNKIRNTDQSIPRELDLYYVVDLTGFDHDPQGVWIQALNTQVVLTYYSRSTEFYMNTIPTIIEEPPPLDELADIPVENTALNLAYFVNDQDIIEPLFINLGLDVLEVKPSFRECVEEGLHINLRGSASLAAGRGKVKSIVITPDKFRSYGIYASKREWEQENLKRNKSYHKDDIKKLSDLFKSIHEFDLERHEETEEYASIKDHKLFGDFTIGMLIESITELSKLDSLIKNMFKQK